MAETESFPDRIRRVLEENIATAVGLSLVALLTTVWTLKAPGVYRRLYTALEDNGILALVFGFFAATVWCWVGWRAEKKKEKLFFERLVPVPGAGYSRDPKNGEIACPQCASEGRTAYLKSVGSNFICWACDKAVSGTPANRS